MSFREGTRSVFIWTFVAIAQAIVPHRDIEQSSICLEGSTDDLRLSWSRQRVALRGVSGVRSPLTCLLLGWNVLRSSQCNGEPLLLINRTFDCGNQMGKARCQGQGKDFPCGASGQSPTSWLFSWHRMQIHYSSSSACVNRYSHLDRCKIAKHCNYVLMSVGLTRFPNQPLLVSHAVR
jgi:hypothetical protein